jgi:short-subunit dehydrogenase
MKDTTFRENVVIITGASFGIGQQLALQLAGYGAWLVLAARNVEKLEDVSKQCDQQGGRVIVLPTDVADPTQCQNLIKRTVGEYGRIDTVINNAGIGMASRFDELQDLALFEKVFRVNFFGSVYCTHYALPYLKKTRGRVVGISSLKGKYPSATADAYSPSKHAMAGFFDSLRIELANCGVSVTMIYPGWVSTGISSRALWADGTLTGILSKHEKNAMPVDVCARMILDAVAKRKREVVMTFLGKLGLWLRPIAPKFVDEVARKGSEE